MQLRNLKRSLLALDLLDDDPAAGANDVLEVLADNLSQALEIARLELDCPLEDLDYEILEKGDKGILGVGRTPYRVRVSRAKADNRWDDLEDLKVSLSGAVRSALSVNAESLSQDGKVLVRIYKTGVMILVSPPKGDGIPARLEVAKERLQKAGVMKYDPSLVEKAVKEASNRPVKVAEWIPKPDADSTLAVEVSADEMTAYVTISAPRPGGRHLMALEIEGALRASGVVYGFRSDELQKALDEDRYSTRLVAAQGDIPINGDDAYIDYKVRIEKNTEFKEDESGRVDYLSRDLVENVVQGQILAELVPEKPGKPGRTVTNKVIPTKPGKPTDLKPGKGTILSEDGRKLIAERNGQVVYKGGRLNVEEIFTVAGDVGLDTGNIMFLGSVNVLGSVTDNMQVKAAGNIEIGGNVQKSHIEAEGDIIIRQGIQGRDGAVIESTTGSVFAKFIQNATISVEQNITVSEGIMHAKIAAGGIIICNGKRAQIVGGEVIAGEEVRVKNLGAQANTPTSVTVGTNPKVLQQIKQLQMIKVQGEEKLNKVEQNIRVLQQQKQTSRETFDSGKEETLVKMLAYQEKLRERIKEAENETEQLNEYMQALSAHGKVHVEKTLYPGVTIEINGAKFVSKDEYHSITLMEEKGNIKIVPYQPPESEMNDWRKRRYRRK